MAPTSVLRVALVLALVGALAASLVGPGLGAAPALGETTVLDLWIEQQLAYRGLPGLALAVVHDQEVVWSRAYGWADVEARIPMTTSTPFRMGSITKLFTATAVMQLRDAGKLRLDDPVSQHLSWFSVDAGEGSPAITIRQLLTHTAGLPREASFPYWTDHEFPSRAELITSLADLEAPFAPATRYKYSNLGMALLGEIVAAVSGQSYADYVAAQVFDPLMMFDSTAAPTAEDRSKLAVGYMRRRGDGSRGVFEYYDTRALAPAANIVSTVEDMARFAALQFRDDSPEAVSDGGAGGASAAGGASGASRARPVLVGSTLREMQRLQWLKPGWSSGRGLGFSVSERDGKTIVSHGGWIAGNRSHLLLVPSEKIAVVALVNADDGQPHVFGYEAYDTLAPALLSAHDRTSGRASGQPPTEASAQVADQVAAQVADTPRDEDGHAAWRPYFGLYADPWEWEYRVLELDGDLVMYSYSYPPADGARDGVTVLELVADHSFRMPDGGMVVFEFDDNGQVERIKRRSDYIYPVESRP